MAKKKSYGKTASAKPITDELVEQLADKAEAEAGYDVDETLHAVADARRSAPPPPASSPCGSTLSYAKRSPSEPSATTRRPPR